MSLKRIESKETTKKSVKMVTRSDFLIHTKLNNLTKGVLGKKTHWLLHPIICVDEDEEGTGMKRG